MTKPVARRCAAIAAAMLMALPAMAQELPNLREARNMVFAERGAIEWEVIPHESLSPADLATLGQINQIQPQPYYAAMAIHPASGLASERTSLAANFHDEDSARATALAACGEACVVVMVIRPEGWEPGRALQLSAEATAALRDDYRALPRRSRAMAISPATGRWGVGESREAAMAACGAADCRPVIEG
jgi:hypothetical protein